MARRRTVPIAAVSAALALAVVSAHAQNARPAAQAAASRRPGGRCAYVEANLDQYGKQPFRNPPEIRSVNGRLSTTLTVTYTNPATTSIAGCPVTLRSYNGQLVGPTLRVRPGDVLGPDLDNQLPRETAAQVDSQFQQENGSAFLDMRPYSFNTTNLHTHGLHVSPNDSSDNVLLAIQPQSRFHYAIRLPGNHTRGTYWYHAHTHGSTAIQVGSAMAGALIVDDDPAQIPEALRRANEHEKVMVIQTILYDTTGQANNITAFFPTPTPANACQTGGPTCTWPGSHRHTTINGQLVPIIEMRPGEVQRWRMIDASFRETIALKLEGHALNEIALDGIYTGRIDTWAPGQDVLLFPGYRSDVLVQASRTPGDYQLIDDSASTAPALRGVAERAQLLAIVRVRGEPVDMRLPTDEEMARLNPFPGVELPLTADGVQEVVFKLGAALQATDTRNSFQVNYEAFTDTRIRYLQLNHTDMWSLTTVGDPAAVPANNAVPALPHVFHIHINPFQVYRTGPNGQPELVWKDTQLVPAGDTVNIYTQYKDYTGTFVMHCHILDHEDLGMMQALQIVPELPIRHPPPNGQGMTGMGSMPGMPGMAAAPAAQDGHPAANQPPGN